MARPLSTDEIVTLARNCSTLRERAIFCLELLAGLKHRHVANLRLQHVLDNNLRIREWFAVPRSPNPDDPPQAWRRIVLPCRSALMQHLYAEGVYIMSRPVFVAPAAPTTCISARQVTRLITDLFQRAAVDVPFPGHALTSTYWEHWDKNQTQPDPDWAQSVVEVPLTLKPIAEPALKTGDEHRLTL